MRLLKSWPQRSITGNDPQRFAGKYITIWQKSGDKWEIKEDIWNLNK
jgi:hypothetical protein